MFLNTFLRAVNPYPRLLKIISVLDNFSPISAGFSHAGCALNGVSYMWGFNGINCSYDRSSVHTGKKQESLSQ